MLARHRMKLLNTATGLGYVLLVISVLGDGDVSLADLSRIGFGLVICGLMRSATAIWEHGHQRGYDTGYGDGRRVALPVVVELGERREARAASRTH